MTATFLSPAQDPRFWSGAPALQLKSFSPAKAGPGAKLTIKGKSLVEAQAVVIGGAVATIESLSPTKLVVAVPSQALPQAGLVTVTAASGEAVTKKDFTVK